jgi:hypothetical protein
MRWLAIFVGLFGIIYFPFFHYTNIHELGVMKNIVSGDLRRDDPGFNFSAPWVLVAKLDIRPQRVCITSRSRIMRCKLGSLDANNFRDLVAREGFRYYWWDNRISFNFGHDEEYRGIRDLIRGYSFSDEKYSFVKIEQG